MNSENDVIGMHEDEQRTATLRAERADDCRRLHERLKLLAAQRAALDAVEARYLVLAEESEIWSAFGYTTMLAYLEAELGYGPHTASERLRVAHALRELPRMAARLEAGELHHSTVRELTRVATYETEEAWLEAAHGKNLRQVERLVAGHRMGDSPDDDPDPALDLRKLTIEVSAATYALHRQAHRHVEAQTGQRLTDDAVHAMMCRATIDGGTGTTDRPMTQVSVTVCPSCERATQDGAGIEADIAPASLARILCDAEILGDSSASVARVTSSVTPRVRRQVFARDHHRCVVPGCRNARFLDIHHIQFQQLGGTHEMSNLCTLCNAHHDLLHHGKLAIRGLAPDLEFTRITEDGDQIELTNAAFVPRGTALEEEVRDN